MTQIDILLIYNTYLNARLDFYNAMLNYNVTAANLEKEVGVPIVFSDKMILEDKPPSAN